MQNHAKSTETWDHSTSGEQHIPVHALQLEKGPTESHQGLRQQRQNLWDLVPLVPLDIFNPSPGVDWNCQKIHQIGYIKNPRLPSGVFALDIQTALFCLQPAVFVRDPANVRFGQWCWDQRPCCKFIWTNYKLEVTDGTAKKSWASGLGFYIEMPWEIQVALKNLEEMQASNTRRVVLSKLRSENLAVRLLIDSKWVLLVERWVSYPPRHAHTNSRKIRLLRSVKTYLF